MKTVSVIAILILLFACPPVSTVGAAVDSELRIKSLITLPSEATGLSYSPDGTKIAVGHADGSVTIWEIKFSKLLTTIQAHKKGVNTVQFTATGSLLVTIGDDKRARIWSTSDWSEKGSIEGVASSGAVSPNGKWLAGQDPKQTIWLWDLAGLKQIKPLTETGKGGVSNMSFMADSKYLALPYKRSRVVNIETTQAQELVMASDKKTAVKAERTGEDQVRFSLGKLQDDDAITHNVSTSRTGALVALGRGWYGQPAFVDVWDVSAKKRLGRFKPKGSGRIRIMRTSFSFDNTLLAIEGAENARIWNIAKGKEIATVEGGGLVQFSPTALELAVTDENELIFYVLK